MVKMIEDLDIELKDIKAEAVLIIGSSTDGNPSLQYVCGVMIPRGGVYIKKVSMEPILIVGDIDTANAEKGLVKNVYPFSKYNYYQLQKEYGKDGASKMYSNILKELGVSKRIVLAGMVEAGQAIDLSRHLEGDGFEVIADGELVERVRRTKSPHEIELIADVARRTEDVVLKTWEMLQNTTVTGDTLQVNKRPMKVKDVKMFINARLAEHELIASIDTVFAPEADGADPHNHGTPDRKIKTGVPIVFDIFPKNIHTGYCFDTTRTFIIGKAPQEVHRMYDDVLQAQQTALDQIKENNSGKTISESVCDVLERKGYKTPRYYMKHPNIAMEEGYIHGLGHGVGLTIGESPYLSLVREYILKEGDVVTVEPGVYYPGKFGIRIEDTVTVEKSVLKNFSTLIKELEL